MYAVYKHINTNRYALLSCGTNDASINYEFLRLSRKALDIARPEWMFWAMYNVDMEEGIRIVRVLNTES